MGEGLGLLIVYPALDAGHLMRGGEDINFANNKIHKFRQFTSWFEHFTRKHSPHGFVLKLPI